MTKTAFELLTTFAWAIEPAFAETMATIAMRESEFHGNPEALEKKLGRPLGNAERSYTRGSTAVVPVSGAMFRYANIMTELSGATSYEMLAKDIQAALDNPAVKNIVLKIDSPGGEVKGVSQLARMVRDANTKKPVIAYIDGMGASAAYWLASAASKIIAADTATIGSIGAMVMFTSREPRSGEKSYTFVSSQSPMKNKSPDTPEGADAIQRNVDALAGVFISAVAENRGTTEATVLANYGGGDVFVAAEALQRGMIDGVADFETMLTNEEPKMDYSIITAESLAAERPDLVTAIQAAASSEQLATARAEGAAAERERIAALDEMIVPGAEALVQGFKADGTTADVAAVAIVKHLKAAQKVAGESALANMRAAETDNQQPTAAVESEPKTDAAKMDEIVATSRAAGVIF